MAITSVKTGSSFTNLKKYDSMLAGNTAYDPSATYLIQRIAGTGSSATISFTSIPSTYSHLQVRILGRGDGAGTSDAVTLYANNDTTGTNYTRHRLSGDGATVVASGSAGTINQLGRIPAGGAAANIMGTTIIDILDYASTSKNKTFRALTGQDQNGTGQIWLTSGLWMSTSAINRVDLTIPINWTTATTIALYGMKG